jgi:putative ABC transport system ATP-binding protein
MILRWTARNVLAERGGLVAASGGIAASLLLVLVLDGMFAGEAERIVSFVRDSGADVWVMQPGVENVHMASSLLRAGRAREVAAVPGVAAVAPILYVSAFLSTGDREWSSYVVGRRPADELARPRAMVAGTASPGPGEAVIPDVVAAQSGVEIGGEVSFLGRTFRVAGVSAGTYSMANSVTFVALADLAEILSSPEGASYLLVAADAGADATELARRIEASVSDVNALPASELVDRDRRLALQMGVDVIRVMTWIGGLLRPSSGRILVDEVDLTALPESELASVCARKIGFVFQAFNLLANLTAEENVLFPALLVSEPAHGARERARALLERLGLGERRRFLPRDLSGGEKQRVAVARALINEPSIILADEPTGNLDSRHGQEVMMILHDVVHDDGRAVLVVTHDPRAEDVADRILWLEDGALRDRKRDPHVWVRDPVCGMRVDEWTAVAAVDWDARRWVFCSERCRERFGADPARYAASSADPG